MSQAALRCSCAERQLPAEVYVGGLDVQLPEWQPWPNAVKDKLDSLMNAEVNVA